MLLAVDVGNTNIVLGLFDGRGDGAELVHDWRMRTEPRITADELAVSVRGLLGELAGKVTGVATLSTVPAVLHTMREMFTRYWPGLPQVIVEPGVRTGVGLLVDNPKEVGADRVANTLAAHTLFGTACVIVDFGTSTNIDVVSPRGELLGAALAPGVDISVDALAARAAQLVKVEPLRPRSVIGKNTVECLQSGIVYGFAGQVDGLVTRIVDELAADGIDEVTVLATGGLAPLVIEESRTIRHYVSDLTLLGLRLIYERNTP